MVHFNELRILPDGKTLIIDVSILSESYFSNVYLDSIVIDNQDTYVNGSPSSNPVFEYTIPNTTNIAGEPINHKHLRLTVHTTEVIGGLNNLLFVYVRTKGVPSPDTPCGMDDTVVMGTVCNMYPYYQQAMNYIKELGNTCTIPQDFTDFILKMKALELSVKTGNYTNAIKYYNKFFNNKYFTVTKGGCGCGNT